MKSEQVLMLILMGREVVSVAIPRQMIDQNPGLVRRMTDDLVKKVEAGEPIDVASSVSVTVGSGVTTREVKLDSEYFNDDDEQELLMDSNGVPLVKRHASGHGGSGHSSGHSGGHSGDGHAASHPSSHGSVYGGGGGAVFVAGATAAAAAGLLAEYAIDYDTIWPGDWPDHELWVYRFNETFDWNFYNATLQHNETKPVACVCAEHESCTCKATTDSAFMADLLGNGTFQGLNKTQVTVANLDVNGASVPTILLNGTVANGTTSTSAAPSIGVSRSSAIALACSIILGGFLAL